MNAVKMRRLLASLLVAAIALLGAGYYFAAQTLDNMVAETNRYKIDVDTSSDKIAKLSKLATDMTKYEGSEEKISLMTFDSNSGDYKDTIRRELDTIASRNGVTLTDITFAAASTTGAQSPPAATPGGESQGGSLNGGGGADVTQPAEVQPTVIGGGVSAIDVSVTFADDTRFVDYLSFMRTLESNLPILQVSSVNLTPMDTDPTRLSSPSMQLSVYLR